MANFLAGLLGMDQGKKNNVLANKFFYQRQEPELRTQYPYAYGLLGGLAGTAPDEMGGSVLDPRTARVQEGAKVGFPLSVVAALSPLTKGMSVGASTKNVGAPLAQVMERKPFVYPRQAALDTAQKNAALPVEQGGLGLRPDNTPMERAQAMGYSTDAYHGGTSDYQVIKKNKVTPYGDRFFSSKDPEYATEYAMSGAITGDTPKVTAWRQDTSNGAGPNIMPLMLGEHKASSFEPVEFVSKPWKGPLGENPQFVRSRFAAFDPKNKNAADLLGRADPALLGIIGAGGLLGLGAYNSK